MYISPVSASGSKVVRGDTWSHDTHSHIYRCNIYNKRDIIQKT